MVGHRFLTSLMSHFFFLPAVYDLFCSVKRKEFQILTRCKVLFGIKGWRGWKGSTTNCHRLLLILRIFSWFTVKNKAPFKSCKPTSWTFLGLSWALISANPFGDLLGFHALYPNGMPFRFSQARLCMPPPWLSCMCPKVLLCHLVSTLCVSSRGIPPPSSSGNPVLGWQHPWGDLPIFSED